MTQTSDIREVIVIGGGLAGLSAAIYLGRNCRNALLIHCGRSIVCRWLCHCG